jgi:hypothetical protein
LTDVLIQSWDWQIAFETQVKPPGARRSIEPFDVLDLAAARKVYLLNKFDRKIKERERMSKMEGKSGRPPTSRLFDGERLPIGRRQFPGERSVKE